MAKATKRKCSGCGQEKTYRSDQLRCPDCASTKEPSETHKVEGDTWEISIPRTRIQTLEELIEHCKVDLSVWTVDRWICNKWEFGAKEGFKDSQVIKVTPLFQIKAWLKRKVEIVAAKNEIAALREDAKKFSPNYPVRIRTKELRIPSGNLLEINLTDHHFGKLAWAQETNGQDYDVKIAERIWDEATDALLGRVIGQKFDQIIFVVGNDLLNSDNKNNLTTHGTPVTTDSRYQKTFRTARKAVVRSIEKMRSISPVRVVVIPGNHDENAAWHLGDSLECWFSKCGDVHVDNLPSPRKYLQWGSVMLMWTHGYKGKLSDYPSIMAAEAPEMWGATTVREVHTGDKHYRKVEEFHGVAVRILPTLCATDDWHSRMGYTNNIRCSEAFIWHKEQGLIGTAVYTEPEQITKRKVQ